MLENPASDSPTVYQSKLVPDVKLHAGELSDALGSMHTNPAHTSPTHMSPAHMSAMHAQNGDLHSGAIDDTKDEAEVDELLRELNLEVSQDNIFI